MKDSINDLINVTMDFGLVHSDYIVDYQQYNADEDLKDFLKSLSLSREFSLIFSALSV